MVNVFVKMRDNQTRTAEIVEVAKALKASEVKVILRNNVIIDI